MRLSSLDSSAESVFDTRVHVVFTKLRASERSRERERERESESENNDSVLVDELHCPIEEEEKDPVSLEVCFTASCLSMCQ